MKKILHYIFSCKKQILMKEDYLIVLDILFQKILLLLALILMLEEKNQLMVENSH